jgi:N-acetylmuramoyl-L-alanine amidase
MARCGSPAPVAGIVAAALLATFTTFTFDAKAESVEVPFLTEEAPLESLAKAFGYRIERDVTTARVRLLSDRHEIVIAPGLYRALVDGRGYPLLGRPRYVGGALVVPPDLADVMRRLGHPRPGAAVPPRVKPEPGVRPKAAFAPAPGTPARAILGSLGRERVEPVDRAPGASGHSAARPQATGRSKGDGEREAPGPSAGFIVIDPGHGGRDGGARGQAGTKEKDVVLDIAKRLAAELRRKGVRLTLTRRDDRYLSPEARARASNSLKPDALVSLHTNSYRQASVAGVETWVSDRKYAPSKRADRASRTLAEAVQRELVRATRSRDRGVRRGSYKVLRRSKVPAALVEVGFISNAAEEKKLADAKWREKIAKALAKAVLGSGVLVKRAK